MKLGLLIDLIGLQVYGRTEMQICNLNVGPVFSL